MSIVKPKKRLTRGMLGSIQNAASYDPRLAYTLAQMFATGKYTGLTGWEIFNIRGTFAAGSAAGKQVEAQLSRMFEADMLIRKVTYTVQRPTAFAGSPLKGQFDFYNAKNPLVNFRLTINALIRYVIAVDQTPLENIEEIFDCVCPAGLVLTASSTVAADFTSLRTIPDAEGSSIVTITLHGQRLPYGVYASTDPSYALRWLTEQGYFGVDPEAEDEGDE